MTDVRDYLTRLLTLMPEHRLTRFMLDHGRTYPTGPHTFALPRDEEGLCFMNATLLARRLPHLTYVEGKVVTLGLPIEHAWCVDEEGVVVDTTLRGAIVGGGMDRVGEYFGVPFKTEYVLKAALTNGYYGLLDFAYARKTLPKLVELGLDEGQRWLLDRKLKRGKLVAGVLMALLVLHPHETRAWQDRTFYGADGRVVARSATDSRGNTTVYGADGRVETRSTPNGTVYGADGRVILREGR